MEFFVVLMLQSGVDGGRYIVFTPELEILELSLLTIFDLGVTIMSFFCILSYDNYTLMQVP